MKTKTLYTFGLAGMLLLLGSCDRTRIVSSYETSNMEDSYNNLYVVGLSGELMPENAMENYLVSEIEKNGYVAAGDEDTFEPNMEITDENRGMIEDKLRERGHDAILTFSMVDVDEELEYVEGQVSRAYYPTNYGYYGNYWNYYSHYAPRTYTPGYYTSNTVYHMEANLYDLKTGNLVWAARSETVDPLGADVFAENFAEAVVGEMKDKGVISSKKNVAMK